MIDSLSIPGRGEAEHNYFSFQVKHMGQKGYSEQPSTCNMVVR